ncbi:MAG: hypothetical protein KatS3mg014_1113 [Actinomycetota bacterium]|nr:MAG: hypothetical protein KatS3mg014_1113 [Actinomycetota bacterium]
MGDTPTVSEELQDAFARIEAAVAAGDTDLGRLGFWRLVRQVKVDPVLSAHWADVVGRIDRAAFEARVRPRFPVWLGNLVLALGTLVGGLAVVLAMRATDPVVAGVALVAAAGIWSVSVHCLAHWVVGRLVGIRFLAYSFGGPFPPRPGLKTDYATYLRVPPSARAWMHASGALATKAAPFVALGFWWATDAPAWAAWACGALGVAQIVTDVLFSTKSSDWKKVIRERRVARSQLARR